MSIFRGLYNAAYSELANFINTRRLLDALVVNAENGGGGGGGSGGSGNTFSHPNRLDLSVNHARVSTPYGDVSVLQTSTGTNALGAYNGTGTGNKAILGFKGLGSGAGTPLASIVSVVFDWMPLTITPPIPPPAVLYANLVVDLGIPVPPGPPGGLHIFVIDTDPAVAGPLNVGTITSPAPGVLRMTHLTASNYVQIVDAPPALPLLTPALGGAPWQTASYKYSDILAVYPSAKLVDAITGDLGMPKSPTVTTALMLLQGDSTQLQMLASAMLSMKVNGVSY